MDRDDLYTVIHKALRRGLVDVLVRAGSTDHTDDAEVAALGSSWRRVEWLLRSHASHEREFIHPALAARVPGGIDSLDAEHDRVHELLDGLAVHLSRLEAEDDPQLRRQLGLEFYRALGRFTATALAHFDEEETRMMPRLWSLLTDDQIARIHASIMSSIGPDEAASTFELMDGALNAEELDVIRRQVPEAAASGARS